ncbi:MAG TPA: glycosyltransferase family 87 protein, partial [bacterium]|nr:glycosyltransferase family 87 protein [bacterium]
MRRWVVLILLVVVAAAFVAFAVEWVERCAARGDVLRYFEAGEAILTDGDPYAGSSLATAGYLCAPFFALLMVPFALLPRVVAAALWFVFNFGSLILLFSVSLYLLESPAIPLSAWLRRKLVNLRGGKLNWVLVATAAVSARLWWDNLGSGQINVPLWAFGFLGVYLIRQGKKGTGGAVMGAAVLVKLMAAPLLLYLLIRRKFRALLSVVIAAAVLSTASAAFLGWGRNAHLIRRWYQIVLRPAVAEHYYYVIERNESVPASLYAYNRLINRGHPPRYLYVWRHLRWLNAATVALFASVIAFFVVKCGFIKRRAGPAADNLLLGLIVLTGVLLQPLAWLQHFVVAIFPYMAVLYYAPRIEAAGVRYACYTLLALSFAGHTLIAADIWGAATEDA